MQEILTDYEFKVAKKLLNIALANAAASFSKMANIQVVIKDFTIHTLITEDFATILNVPIETPCYVLTTEMKGDLLAKSYLIFNQQDISKINEIFLKQDDTLIKGELTPLQQSLLLELDNIVAASVVTQVANLLNVFAYGDVPHLHALSKNDTLIFFHQEIQTYNPALCMQAKLQLSETQLTPSFSWIFKPDFLSFVKKIVNQKQHLSFI